MYSYGQSDLSKSCYYRPGNSNTDLRKPQGGGRPSTGKSHKYQQRMSEPKNQASGERRESTISFSQMHSQKYKEDEDSAINRKGQPKKVYFSDS